MLRIFIIRPKQTPSPGRWLRPQPSAAAAATCKSGPKAFLFCLHAYITYSHTCMHILIHVRVAYTRIHFHVSILICRCPPCTQASTLLSMLGGPEFAGQTVEACWLINTAHWAIRPSSAIYRHLSSVVLTTSALGESPREGEVASWLRVLPYQKQAEADRGWDYAFSSSLSRCAIVAQGVST